MVEEHNRKKLGFRVKLNEFSDKTDEELRYLTGTFISTHEYPDMVPFPHTLTEVDELVQELPENFDLRIEGAITPIKSEYCYGFAL